jgi:hypothetical protein
MGHWPWLIIAFSVGWLCCGLRYQHLIKQFVARMESNLQTSREIEAKTKQALTAFDRIQARLHEKGIV